MSFISQANTEVGSVGLFLWMIKQQGQDKLIHLFKATKGSNACTRIMHLIMHDHDALGFKPRSV